MRFVFHLYAVTLLLLATACVRAEPADAAHGYVGFIWHYPFVDVGSDKIADAGANVMMARCAWGAIQPSATQFNFTSLRQQLQVARQQGIKLVLLLEFNPFCAPDWLKAKCKAGGENTYNYDGTTGTMPRIGSPIFRAAQETMLQQLTSFLRNEDAQHTITHYMPGIEWWFPYAEQYASADQARFRSWLPSRYSSLASLNQAWGSQYTDYAQVQIPWLAFGSSPYVQKRIGMTSVTLQYAAPPAGQSLPTCALATINDWSTFWHQSAAEYINSMATLVKQFDTTRPCASFGTYAWAQAAEWDYVDMSEVRLDWLAHASVEQDIIGMQLCIGAGDTYRQTFGLDMARKYGKPMWDMDLVDFVDGVHIGYDAHEKATHAAIQHGASALFYCNWNGAADFNYYPDWSLDRIQRMLNDGRQALALTRGMKIAVQGALINPIGPIAPGDPAAGRNNVFSLIGWYKLLERWPCTVDVATLHELEAGWASLSKYRWVLVPDCPYISTRALDALTSFSQHGGLLIRGGRLGNYDENGRARTPATLPGIGLSDLGLQYSGSNLVRENHAGGTPPEMLWRPETAQTSQTLMTAMSQLAGAFQQAGVTEPVAVCNGGEDVRFTLFELHGARLIYLVNQSPLPVSGVKLEINLDDVVLTSVHLDMAQLEPGAVQITGEKTLTLPPFRTSAIVRLSSTATASQGLSFLNME